MKRILLACAALLASAAASWQFRASGSRASSAVLLDVRGLALAADAALEGRVLGTRVELDARGRPCTVATLSVERDLVGDARGPFDVRIPGGVLPDGFGMLIAGMPRLAAGEELVLFLSEESSAGLRIPVGLAQGKFRIVRGADGARALVRDGADLALLDLASGEASSASLEAVYDYAEFVAQVHAARAEREARGEPREGR